MFFFLVSSLSFLLLGNPLLVKLLPSWVGELRLLLVLLCQESFYYSFQWIKNYRLVVAQILNCPYAMLADWFASRTGNVEEEKETEEEEVMDTDTTVLDLPELALDCILAKLPPSGLCSMASACTSTRDRCRSDHLWQRHMREKWGRVLAKRGWESCLGPRKESRSSNGLVGSASPRWFCPCSWFKFRRNQASSRRDSGSSSRLPVDSVMARYLSLESGSFWFPAQVYNRENGHLGFMLSCYDAELRYDSLTDTFQARYPPHGQRLANVVEEGIEWERLRAPPVDTPAHDLHVSDCLNDLRPGDHIEIQWRKNKGFPYGWWYGVVGHLKSCYGNENYCSCSSEDTIMLEFNQYTPDSIWRQTTVSRKDHREEGNETDGFYGGIRKLRDKDEISRWRQLWPTEVLE